MRKISYVIHNRDMQGTRPEPWLRGTLDDVEPVARQVLHALELTREDVARWCAPLTGAEMEARPYGLEPVGFHLRHMARSLDRLLSYAEGRQLTEAQFARLRGEMNEPAQPPATFAELESALDDAARHIRAIPAAAYGEPRRVGRARLPSTVGGLLVHCAEHTQRHTGQAVTTAKLLLALRGETRTQSPGSLRIAGAGRRCFPALVRGC